MISLQFKNSKTYKHLLVHKYSGNVGITLSLINKILYFDKLDITTSESLEGSIPNRELKFVLKNENITLSGCDRLTIVFFRLFILSLEKYILFLLYGLIKNKKSPI